MEYFTRYLGNLALLASAIRVSLKFLGYTIESCLSSALNHCKIETLTGPNPFCYSKILSRGRSK